MSNEKVRELLTQALRLLEAEDQELSAPETNGKSRDGTLPPPNGEISLFGKVGRPEYSERKGIAIWEAGFKVVDEDGKWQWINIQAWRKTAIFARDNLPSAAETTAVGKWKSESWTGNDGGERSREVFVVTHFIADSVIATAKQ